MRTTTIIIVAAMLAFSVDVAAKKRIAIALGGFSCGGDELGSMADASKVEFVPVQDPGVLEALGKCGKARCWKKIARKLKADVVIFGSIAPDATRALWLEPRLGEPDILVEVGESSPCELLSGWLARLERGYACHQKTCDAKKCLRHVYSDVTSFGSEALWKSTTLAADGMCRPISAQTAELCKPLTCACLLENEDSLANVFGTVTGCETKKRLVRLQISAPPADDGM